MSDVTITIRLPKELFERAQAAGVQVDNVTEAMIEVIEKQIVRREALSRLLSLAEQIDALPNNLKPTPEEIEAEIRASRIEDLLTLTAFQGIPILSAARFLERLPRG